jgi:manganese/zinc/iron transport system permease protein
MVVDWRSYTLLLREGSKMGFGILLDANTQWVLMGTLLLGLASGVLGSFALLKKQSLIGDAMAHAALPGICIAFLLHGSKSIGWFLVGAALAGLVATYCIQSIIRYSRIKEDTAIGLVLSVFFGFGIVLLTYINQGKGGNQSGLTDFIFGKAASLVGSDVRIISGIALLLLIGSVLLFKEMKILTFDPQFAKGIGLPVGVLNGILMSGIVAAVVIGLQAVGVILMSAMLITPAIAARYWTERLEYMVLISGAIGAVSGVCGTMLSTVANGMPTGPLIIVAATLLFLFSLICAPRRGLLSKYIRERKTRQRVEREHVLEAMYDILERRVSSGQYVKSIKLDEIIAYKSMDTNAVHRALSQLRKEKHVHIHHSALRLTTAGLEEAYNVTLRNRLIEIYLANESVYAHINIREEDILHVSEGVLAELIKLLKLHGKEPLIIPRSSKRHKAGYRAGWEGNK